MDFAVLTPSLRRRLRELARSEEPDVARAHRGRNGRKAGRRIEAARIEDILPGGLVETPFGTVFMHERLYTDLGERPVPLLKKIAALAKNGTPKQRRRGSTARPSAPQSLPELASATDPPERGLFRRYGSARVLYLDIETCGLTSACVFLVGLAQVVERNFVLKQIFARDYAEERALLHEVGRIANESDFLVTFNGKRFDVPFLRDRAVHHRMRLGLEGPHLDLLWMARRRWRAVLPNCRLKTLEWHLLRRRRAGDVPGSEIPGLYHDYVKRGEPHRLIPVFHHNLLDVVSMAELTPLVFDPHSEVYGVGEDWRD